MRAFQSMARWVYRFGILLLLCSIAAGCQTTTVSQYTPHALEDPGVLPEMSRSVEAFHGDQLYSSAPRCAVVWPMSLEGAQHGPENEPENELETGVGDIPAWQQTVIEQAVARHARDHLDRVVDSQQRDMYAKSRLLDVTEKQDRATLARLLRCPYALIVRPLQIGSAYAVVWSRNRVGAEIALVDAANPDVVLWSARHATQRSDGSLPLSPLGVASAVVAAGALNADQQEVFVSLANTVARRVFATLPDLKTPLAMSGW